MLSHVLASLTSYLIALLIPSCHSWYFNSLNDLVNDISFLYFMTALSIFFVFSLFFCYTCKDQSLSALTLLQWSLWIYSFLVRVFPREVIWFLIFERTQFQSQWRATTLVLAQSSPSCWKYNKVTTVEE